MRDIFRSNDEDTGGEVDSDILVKEPAIGMLLDMVLFYFVSCFSFALLFGTGGTISRPKIFGESRNESRGGIRCRRILHRLETVR